MHRKHTLILEYSSCTPFFLNFFLHSLKEIDSPIFSWQLFEKKKAFQLWNLVIFKYEKKRNLRKRKKENSIWLLQLLSSNMIFKSTTINCRIQTCPHTFFYHDYDLTKLTEIGSNISPHIII